MGEKMKRMTKLLTALTLVFGMTGLAQAYTVLDLNVPNARAQGINNSGDIVGFYPRGLSWLTHAARPFP